MSTEQLIEDLPAEPTEHLRELLDALFDGQRDVQIETRDKIIKAYQDTFAAIFAALERREMADVY